MGLDLNFSNKKEMMLVLLHEENRMSPDVQSQCQRRFPRGWQ